MKQFQFAKVNKPQSSNFDLSHERKFTTNMADLTPVFLQEVIPGDRFKVNMEALVRFQPLLAPIMHRINVYIHYFFVPNRIIWEDWEDFITGGRLGTSEPVFPAFQANHDEWKIIFNSGVSDYNPCNLADYMGLPIQQYTDNEVAAPPISQLPFRAYYQIYYDYYRDQNMADQNMLELQELVEAYSLDGIVSPGGNAQTLLALRKRCWEKDYFTSALPWAQRGGEVLLPIAGDAPVTGRIYADNLNHELPDDVTEIYWSDDEGMFTGTKDGVQARQPLNIIQGPGGVYPDGLKADLSEATSTTISDLRRAFALQRWMEKNARGGSRYNEQLLAHFGIKSSDARLQRAEYLGGGKMPVQISEVLQMSQTDTTAQGTMTGHGITGGKVTGFSKWFEEHGFVMGIMSIMPRTAYQQGIPRIFSKFDRYDYAWPEFAHIGEQEVLNQELYLGETGNDSTFGYQERYAEYRFGFDTVHGDLRSGVTGSLDFWHMARKFETRPGLNKRFTQADPTTRIYPLTVENSQVIVQTYADCKVSRLLPKFGTPI